MGGGGCQGFGVVPVANVSKVPRGKGGRPIGAQGGGWVAVGEVGGARRLLQRVALIATATHGSTAENGLPSTVA